MNGTVKFFNQMKGFGFIAGEDNNEYFVHQSDLQDGVRLQDNDAVTFEVVQGDRGPKAVNVGRGSSDASAPAEEAPAEEEAPVEEVTEEEPQPVEEAAPAEEVKEE